MVLVIDNYDSFTYNLVQYLGELGAQVVVRRNDQATMEQLRGLGHARVVISPGPGRPEQAGVSLDVIKEFGQTMPVLGVCLGHQAIGLEAGGTVDRTTPMHGKASFVYHDGRGILEGIANPFEAARYHSLVVERDDLPEELELTAWTQDGLVMATQHRALPRFGVQFHPESILTPEGPRIVERFLALA
jgi:anthranilate synthase/aminodeoxychorismate synthase-like glutamine amidotransferase